jgi:hypothetical protein
MPWKTGMTEYQHLLAKKVAGENKIDNGLCC